jgi:outer membrane protein assembly factor BamD
MASSPSARLDIGYAFFKDKDPVSALAAADHFIKLHPITPTLTMPTI